METEGRPNRTPLIAGGVIAGLVLFVLLLSSCSIIEPGDRGVVVNLGTMSKDVLGEGVHFTAPWARVKRVTVKQTTMAGHTQCFSKDLQTIKVTYSCMYSIPEDRVLDLFQKYAGNPYESLVVPRIEEAIKLASATLTAEAIVKQREMVKAAALSEVKGQLRDLVIVTDLPITNIDLTEMLEKAIEGKQVAEQKALAKEYDLVAAKKDAEISIEKAKGEAEAIRITGEALAKSPNVTLMEAVKKWDGKAPQSLVLPNGSVTPTVEVSR
jgi:prohibitin 2